MDRAKMNGILLEVTKERERQNGKLGQQDHSHAIFASILGEEVGEVHKAVIEDKPMEYRKELIQVAAVAIQMVEAFDRGRTCSCSLCLLR